MKLMISTLLLLAPFFLQLLLHALYFSLSALQLFSAPLILQFLPLPLLFFSFLLFLLTLASHFLPQQVDFFFALLTHGFDGDQAFLLLTRAFQLRLKLLQSTSLAILLLTKLRMQVVQLCFQICRFSLQRGYLRL